MQLVSSVQVGKNGVSENLIETLKTYFKNHQNVKVVFLKSATRDKQMIKKNAEELLEALGPNYTYRIIGFTVIMKKWRKAQR